MTHTERLLHLESDGDASLVEMRARARELAAALDVADAEKAELLTFVASIANLAHGKIRADANTILAKHGLPTVPMSR